MYHDLSCYVMYFLHLATHFKTQPKRCFGFGFLFFFFLSFGNCLLFSMLIYLHVRMCECVRACVSVCMTIFDSLFLKLASW